MESLGRLEAGDTVVLNSNPSLVGVVETTHDDAEPYPNIADATILLHVCVPENIREEFLTRALPPVGYIFVSWTPQEKGCSLVHEDDVTLLDRNLIIGDIVRCEGQNDAMSGVVTDVQDSYVLQPICRPVPGLEGFLFSFVDESTSPTSVCSPSCKTRLPPPLSHSLAHDLIYDVPGTELKRSQDYCEGDLITYQKWLGSINAIDIDVVLLLQDKSVVVVDKPWELHILVTDHQKELIAVPDKLDGIKVPEIDFKNYNAVATIPPDEVASSQFVVTNHRNLKNGRWLYGRYNPALEPVGHVIDVRARRLEIEWLCPNPFELKETASRPASKPPRSLRPYENASSYRSPRELRRNKDLVTLDGSRFSRKAQNEGTRAASDPATVPQHTTNSCTVSMGRDLCVGDQVRWRDQTAAAVKYQETLLNTHGCFRPVPRDSTLEFDLNEFRIVYTKHQIGVLWQDGSRTVQLSTQLKALQPLDHQLFPGDIVTAREGMRMVRKVNDQDVESEFNEMQSFEQKCILLPAKVGVLQSIKPSERVAQVKWFIKPRIEIMEANSETGSMLSNNSVLGDLGETIENVSLYEIMPFDAFHLQRKDLVIVPPPNITKWCLPYLKASKLHFPGVLPLPSRLSQIDSYSASAVLSNVQFVAIVRSKQHIGSLRLKEAPRSVPVEWIGEVVDVRTDGTVSVRLSGADPCLDADYSRDQIVLVIDTVHHFQTSDFFEVMDDLEFSDAEYAESLEEEPPSPLKEEILYEGGYRLDNESDDQDWVTDDETPDTSPEEISRDQDMVDAPDNEINAVTTEAQKPESPQQDRVDHSASAEVQTSTLTKYLTTSPPPSFQILSISPPSNQFRASEPPTTNSTFLRRLHQEHRILAKALPTNTIYVRTYESRLDLLRCLIIGPENTPYENAPFLIDLHLGPRFPSEPPTAHFHSWTHGLGRCNPNLYEEGKICLSLLGTWQGTEGESWSEKATILQILVSLQGLVFLKDPFYNEAGFESLRSRRERLAEALQYSEKAYVMTRGFIRHALRPPIPALEDVLAWLYVPPTKSASSGGDDDDGTEGRDLLRKAIFRMRSLIRRSEEMRGNEGDVLVDGQGDTSSPSRAFLQPLSQGAMIIARRTLGELEDISSQIFSPSNLPLTVTHGLNTT